MFFLKNLEKKIMNGPYLRSVNFKNHSIMKITKVLIQAYKKLKKLYLKFGKVKFKRYGQISKVQHYFC